MGIYSRWIQRVNEMEHSLLTPYPKKAGLFGWMRWAWNSNKELRPVFSVILTGCGLCVGFCAYALFKRDVTFVKENKQPRWEVVSRERAPLFMIPLSKKVQLEEYDEMVRNRDWKTPTKRNYPSEAFKAKAAEK